MTLIECEVQNGSSYFVELCFQLYVLLYLVANKKNTASMYDQNILVIQKSYTLFDKGIQS